MPRRLRSWVAAVAALAACETATAPERLASYPVDLNGTGLTFHWPADRLPVRYHVPPEAGVAARLVEAGINTWERQLLYGEFSAMLVGDPATADVLVTVISGPPPDVPLTNDPPELGACSGVTGADSLTENNRIVGPLRVRIAWDDRFSDTDVANCLARVVAHEIGHTMGLFGHSPDTLDLMNTNPRVQEPSISDRQALQVLYHLTPDILPPERP